ncbi:hypothetical protein [Bacterioplanoides sp.]|uniref:hypothetical protein n=1 Tax=Bacterioplanoides sp. TaxID=2066072 RepID=UPI003AFF6315
MRYLRQTPLSHLLLCLAFSLLLSPWANATNDDMRLLRGAFYFSYLDEDYAAALHYLERWREQEGAVEGSSTDLTAAGFALESQVMEAAIYLALGMEHRAQALYRQVEQSGSQASGDAWFHLARRWMELSRWQDAENSITRALTLSDSLNPEYLQQALFIQSSSRSHQDKIAQSVLSEQMDSTGIWAGLARYNRILAGMRLNAKSRDLEKWIAVAVADLSSDDYETQSLRDRILLIAGIYALDAGKHRRAERYFKEISQNTVFTAPGLLHYGWTLVEQWKYQQAMQPWRILQQRFNNFHPAVMESILGVPHALELLNATTQSLKTYEVVEGRLQQMLSQLRAVNQRPVINDWMDNWLTQSPVSRVENNATAFGAGHPQWGWLNQTTADLPDHQLTRILQPVLDDARFNQRIAQLRDLQQLQQQLNQQNNQLQLWQAVVTERQQRLQKLGGEQLLQQLAQRQQQLLAQVQQMQQALNAEDDKVFAYASAADQKNIGHLAAVIPAVEYLQQVNDPTRDLQPYKERWRRVRGVQLWNIYQDQPQRRWQTQQSFWQLRKNSEQLSGQLANSHTALAWANSSWQGFPQQLSQARQQLAQQQQQVALLDQQQREQLAAQVQHYLTDLDGRLSDYLAQSRLSIARLYDDALQNYVVESSGADDADQGGSDE